MKGWGRAQREEWEEYSMATKRWAKIKRHVLKHTEDLPVNYARVCLNATLLSRSPFPYFLPSTGLPPFFRVSN